MYDTTAKKAIVIDINALVFEADIKDQELQVSITEYYVPVQDAKTFDWMKIANKNDLNKGFDELYKFYDEFTEGRSFADYYLTKFQQKKNQIMEYKVKLQNFSKIRRKKCYESDVYSKNSEK